MKAPAIFLFIIGYLCSTLIATSQITSQRETTDLLPEGTFTNGIEGPATDKAYAFSRKVFCEGRQRYPIQ